MSLSQRIPFSHLVASCEIVNYHWSKQRRPHLYFDSIDFVVQLSHNFYHFLTWRKAYPLKHCPPPSEGHVSKGSACVILYWHVGKYIHKWVGWLVCWLVN